jgi:hypothetical protein
MHRTVPPPRTDARRLLALFVLAVTLRLLYVASTSPDAAIGSTDAWGYRQLALNVVQGNGFSLRQAAPFLPDSVRTPLYPIFLLVIRRLFGPSLRAATIVQAFIDGCTTLLVWWLATQLGGRRAGRVAALLYALNPTQIRYVNELLTETLLSFLLALCVCALVRYVQSVPASSQAAAHDRAAPVRRPRSFFSGWIVAVALLTGLAALCKPNVQFLPLIWLGVIALARRSDWRRTGRWRRTAMDAVLMTSGFFCVLAPWVLRNCHVFGRCYLSTAFEGNVSRVSAPATLAAVRGEYVMPWSAEWEALFGEIVSQTAAQYGWNQPWDTLSARELDKANEQVYWTARQVLAQHPAAWLASHAQGLARYLEPQTYRACYARFAGHEWPPDVLDDVAIYWIRALARADWRTAGQIIAEERWNKLDALQGVVWWGTVAGQLVGLSLAVRGAWRLRRQPALAAALLLTILYVLWIPGPIAYERFRIPVTSLISALIGVAGAAPIAERRVRSATSSIPQSAIHARDGGLHQTPRETA